MTGNRISRPGEDEDIRTPDPLDANPGGAYRFRSTDAIRLPSDAATTPSAGLGRAPVSADPLTPLNFSPADTTSAAGHHPLATPSETSPGRIAGGSTRVTSKSPMSRSGRR